MADTAASTLLQWETTHFSEDPVGHSTGVLVHKSESGTVRLVQTACKALSKHGSEQSEYISLLQYICHLITYQRIHLHHLGVIDLIFYFMMLVLFTTFHH